MRSVSLALHVFAIFTLLVHAKGDNDEEGRKSYLDDITIREEDIGVFESFQNEFDDDGNNSKYRAADVDIIMEPTTSTRRVRVHAGWGLLGVAVGAGISCSVFQHYRRKEYKSLERSESCKEENVEVVLNQEV